MKKRKECKEWEHELNLVEEYYIADDKIKVFLKCSLCNKIFEGYVYGNKM